MSFEDPISAEAGSDVRAERYREVERRLRATLEEECEPTAAMATAAGLLHHAFAYFDWTGFYRRDGDRELVVGPYQGTLGCLRIPFDDGVCGAAARTESTQWVDDVEARDDHIACSSSTSSEVVVPIVDAEGRVDAVLDVDSDIPAVFDRSDVDGLESLADWLGGWSLAADPESGRARTANKTT